MACIHCLHHLDNLGSANFSHDDAVGAHTQAVAQQITDRDHARAVEPTGSTFEPDHMTGSEGQFCRVFDRDDALA
ncbi:hypothetical protein D3C87_2067990 [compost metagenome]